MTLALKTGLGAFVAVVVVLAVVFWHFLELWFVHSTVGPNITATYPGMALAAVPAAVVAWLLRPWAERVYAAHHARHAAHHEQTRSVLAEGHAATHARLDDLVARLSGESGPPTRADVAEIRELVAASCSSCGAPADVGRLCPVCHPEVP